MTVSGQTQVQREVSRSSPRSRLDASTAFTDTLFNLMETFFEPGQLPLVTQLAAPPTNRKTSAGEKKKKKKVYKDPPGSLINTQTQDVVVSTNTAAISKER